MKRNKKKLSNKGFSLVELIVVIAIMAILVGVMAPQVMKYIGKSRTSVDTTNGDSIKSAVQAALADEAANKDILTRLAADTDHIITLDFNGDPGTGATTLGTIGTNKFITELDSIIGEWPTAKDTSKQGFRITINSNLDVTVATY
jgi:prepilin-type N-terminal cleavage/methylation domain-containing protein